MHLTVLEKMILFDDGVNQKVAPQVHFIVLSRTLLGR